jgi:hypothetical protein
LAFFPTHTGILANFDRLAIVTFDFNTHQSFSVFAERKAVQNSAEFLAAFALSNAYPNRIAESQGSGNFAISEHGATCAATPTVSVQARTGTAPATRANELSQTRPRRARAPNQFRRRIG